MQQLQPTPLAPLRARSTSPQNQDYLCPRHAAIKKAQPKTHKWAYGREGRRYTEIADHTWSFIPPTITNTSTPIVGYGSVPIPSYNNIALMGPDRTIHIRCITWNINDKSVKILAKIVEHLESLPEKEDVICIALQELPPSSKNFHEEALAILTEPISDSHEVYVSHRSWSQMMVVFLKREHLRYSTVPIAKFVPSATIPKPMRTKGGIGICFRMYQRWIIIVGCHLSHGSSQNRIQDYHKLVRTLTYTALKDFTGMTHMFAADVVLWCGDLNFRIGKDLCIDWTADIGTQQECIQKSLAYDELSNVRTEAIAFMEFEEADIRFRPTHKFQLDREDYVEKRIPSYTDRILYYIRDPKWIKVLDYNSIEGPTQSDHRPVYSNIRLNVINKPIPQRYYSADCECETGSSSKGDNRSLPSSTSR